MSRMTAGTLFSGFGGVDIGMKMAGLKVIKGLEYIPALAEWNMSQLGHPVIITDILDITPEQFGYVDWLHASPPCPSFSVANSNKGETRLDLKLAHKVAEYIIIMQPRVFTLENVRGYAKSKSWVIIAKALNQVYGHFGWNSEIVNFADFGVPQTRIRMMVRAVEGVHVAILRPHIKTSWIGWYEAVKDIVDTFPDSELAPWQVERLSKAGYVFDGNTLVTDKLTGSERMPLMRDGIKPAATVRSGTIAQSRAVLIDAVSSQSRITTRDQEQPAMTTVGGGGRLYPKAMLFNPTTQTPKHRDIGQPAYSVTKEMCKQRAMLFSQGNGQPVGGDRPSATMTTNHNQANVRAQLNHRTVLIPPRGSARFCSFPDWYELPEKKTLAMTGLGNSVPPVGFANWIKPILEAINV